MMQEARVRAIGVRTKLVISFVVVLASLCTLGWMFSPGTGLRPHLSLTLPRGNRFDVALVHCTANNPAFVLLMYTDFTRENRFIHERMSLLGHLPIQPPCP